MSAHTLHAALALRALSIGTIPVHDKAPALAAWTEYQERLATPEELAAQHKNGVDLAVVTGTVSANLETLDIDAPALIVPLKDQVRALAGDDLLDKLVMARTPSGGEHWYYRHTGVPEGSTVLARDHAGAIAIETRGQGGYAVIPPSAGRTYRQGTLEQVKTISTAERSCQLMAARTLHVPPPDPVHEKAAISQAVLLDPKMPHGHKLVLLALLRELAFDAWTDITAEVISRRYHMGLRQAKERLRALVALGVIKEKCVYQTDGDDAPRPRYLRRLHRDAINDYWFPKGTSTPAPPVSRPSPGDFYDRFHELVSIRELVQVGHTGKFRAFWRGEQHASVHLHPPDATCPHEHACDYGDNNRHMDAFDVYCLVKGFYRWDGTLHLDKRTGMRAARADYPALQSESAPTVTGFQAIMTHQEAGKKGGRGHKARTNGTGFKRGNSAAYTLARLKRDRPDLYEQVQAGAKTAYAAAIEAGFRSRPLTVTGFTRSNRSRRQSKCPPNQSESSHREPVIIDRGAGGGSPGKQEEPPILRYGLELLDRLGVPLPGAPGAEER